jgi:UDP-N-acetyl-D-glucosamine dehydrogenase
VQRVQDALNNHQKALNGSNILVLGVAYKPDIDDMRESPALDVIHLLRQKGAEVHYHDPYVPAIDHDGIVMACVKDLIPAVRESDCVVIVTNHSDYNYTDILDNARLIFDTRNGMGSLGKDHPKIVRL